MECRSNKTKDISSIIEQGYEAKQILEVLNEASLVSITDRYGNIIYANKKFCEISKYPAEDLIGKNHRIIKSGFHPPEFYSDLWKTISGGKIWRGDIKNTAKDGTSYWVKTIIAPVFEDNSSQPIKYISIRTDITEQKAMQEKIAKDERLAAIGEIAANISHDLRNPLAVIRASVDLIKVLEPNLQKGSIEKITLIQEAIARMTHQIEDVLDYVKPKTLNLQKISVKKMLSNILERMIIPSSIIIHQPPSDADITCDEEKMEIVFVNLILNAIQAMNSVGQIDIVIAEENENVLIQVIDTGPGIPEEVLPKIFEPLFTTKQIGTGLGLASCKSIIEKHGGTIDARNASHNGAIFTIKLPQYD